MSAPLEINGVVKRYGDTVAVAGIDIKLGPDELLALVGPSGCGKSTILRSIAGLVAIESGSIRLRGDLVDDGSRRLPPERRSVGLVFQEHALFPHLTVRSNVAFGVRDLPRREVPARVDEMLDLVNLGELGERYPHELSGGERQRVALARALAPRPALMLFDEPFASLDHNLRVRLRRDVVGALRATSTPAIFVTHFQEEALTIGDRIAVMRAGRIVQLDTPSAVFHQPVDQFVAAFMGDASFLPVVIDETGAASSALGPVDLGGRPAASCWAAVRPDDVRFQHDPSGDAEIVDVEYHGGSWMATVRLAMCVEILVSASYLDAPQVGDLGRVKLADRRRQMIVAGTD